MVSILPVGDAVGEIFVGNGDSIVFLPLFDLHLDFVILSKTCDLLNFSVITLASTQPCLAPSLFMATKFFPGSLISETACSCHPETTVLEDFYLLWLHTCLWEELCHRYGLRGATHGTQFLSFQVLISAEGCYWT